VSVAFGFGAVQPVQRSVGVGGYELALTGTLGTTTLEE